MSSCSRQSFGVTTVLTSFQEGGSLMSDHIIDNVFLLMSTQPKHRHLDQSLGDRKSSTYIVTQELAKLIIHNVNSFCRSLLLAMS